MYYYYSKDKSLHGIIRPFYDSGTFDINVEIHASSYYQKCYPQNAFNYDSNEYWYGDNNQNGLVNLTFCFKNGFVKSYGFELGTSTYESRPSEFMFSSSIDNSSYIDSIYYSSPFNANDVFYFSFRSSPSKCFRLTSIKSVGNSKCIDVKSIELYGEIHNNLLAFHDDFITKRDIINFPSSFLFIILISFNEKQHN